MHQKDSKFSPSGVRHSINEFLEAQTRSIEKFQKNKYFNFLSVLLLICLYASFFPLITLNPDLGSGRQTYFETRYFWIIPSLVPAILMLSLLFQNFRIKKETLLMICFGGLFLILPEVLTYADFAYVPPIIRYSLVFVIAFHLLIFRFSRGLRYSFRLLLFILTELALVFFLDVLANKTFGLSYWITHPYRYIFTFTMLAADEEMKRRSLPFDLKTFSYILSPTNWVTPLPVRLNDWKVSEDQDYLRAKGTLYLLIAFFVLACCAVIQNYRNILIDFDSRLRFVGNGIATYLFYFCFSYTNINIPISLLWWFGFKVPEPYDLPLLSTSPQDRWRRWNFYFYDWYFRSIFFPVFKRTQSYFVAVMASFLLTLFIHLGPQNAEFVMVGLVKDSFSRQFYKKTIFFMSHGLAVYLGMRFEKWIPDEKKPRGWLAVLGMFILMSLIHVIFTL